MPRLSIQEVRVPVNAWRKNVGSDMSRLRRVAYDHISCIDANGVDFRIEGNSQLRYNGLPGASEGIGTDVEQ